MGTGDRMEFLQLMRGNPALGPARAGADLVEHQSRAAVVGSEAHVFQSIRDRCFAGVLAENKTARASKTRGVHRLVGLRVFEQRMDVDTGFVSKNGIAR